MNDIRRPGLITVAVVGFSFLIAALVAYLGTTVANSPPPRETVTDGFDGRPTAIAAPGPTTIPPLSAPATIVDLRPPDAPEPIGPIGPSNPAGGGENTVSPGNDGGVRRDPSPRPSTPEPEPGPTEQ